MTSPVMATAQYLNKAESGLWHGNRTIRKTHTTGARYVLDTHSLEHWTIRLTFIAEEEDVCIHNSYEYHHQLDVSKFTPKQRPPVHDGGMGKPGHGAAHLHVSHR